MGWKGKAGENKLHKKVGAAEDTFHHCFGLGDAGLVLVLEMLWNQGINLEQGYLPSFKREQELGIQSTGNCAISRPTRRWSTITNSTVWPLCSRGSPKLMWFFF